MASREVEAGRESEGCRRIAGGRQDRRKGGEGAHSRWRRTEHIGASYRWPHPLSEQTKERLRSGSFGRFHEPVRPPRRSTQKEGPMNKPATETLSVVVEREVAFPPEKIWRALTQPHLIEEWLMKNDFKPFVDHRFSLL